MTITCGKTGVWILDDVYKKVASNCWSYDLFNDPNSLWVWGTNAEGRLGDGTTIHRSSPVQIPGTQWTCVIGTRALKSDGTLWAWGENTSGQIGDSTIIRKSSPVQVPGTQWCALSTGRLSTTFALKTDGTLWSWGLNQAGLLGQNSAPNRSSPVQIPGTQWTNVSSQYQSAIATKTDGTLWGWGCTAQLQFSSTPFETGISSPILIPGTQWNDIGSGSFHHLGKKTNGSLYGWGFNAAGQIAPDAIVGGYNSCISPTSCLVSVDVHDFSAGGCASFYIKNNGSLYGRGFASCGLLGQNDTIHRSSAVQIPGTKWRTISVVADGVVARAALATKTDCTLWAWGDNGVGWLGDGTTISKSSPIQIPGTQWVCTKCSFAKKLP